MRSVEWEGVCPFASASVSWCGGGVCFDLAMLISPRDVRLQVTQQLQPCSSLPGKVSSLLAWLACVAHAIGVTG
jgi:hypothetical protein